MTPAGSRSSSGWVRRQTAGKARTFIYLGVCAAVVIAALTAVAIAQPWATGMVNPAESVRYMGVHEPDAPNSYSGIDEFAQSVGMQPNLVSYYSPWSEPFEAHFANSAKSHGARTVVQMDPSSVSLARIASGQYDKYLQSFAAEVRAFGSKVVISFGHEMNGNWYSWGYQNTPAKTFVAAWRRIVTVFRTAGAHNVIWLWTVNVINNDLPVPIPDPTPWWPGRSYVNWVGIDGYYYDRDASFAQIFGPTIVAVRALTRDSILIAETGAARSAGQAVKINDLFNGVRTYGLLGFVWFDENVQGRAWRISSPGAFAAFRRNARAFVKNPATISPSQSPSNEAPPS